MCGGIVPAGRAQTPQPVYVINVLVLYTPQAAAGAGGTTAIQGQINQAVLEANTVFQNSQVNARVRLAGTTNLAYTETGFATNDLASLLDPAQPVSQVVASLRKQFAADLVCLVVTNNEDYYFYGLQGPSAENAYSVIQQQVLSGFDMFPVVLSFNFGCQLVPNEADSVGAFPYAYGYEFYDDSSGQEYGTVEALGGYDIRLPYFSNPNLDYDGQPLGVPAGMIGAADNALVLSQTAPIVAGFHGTAVSTYPPAIDILSPAAGEVLTSGTNLPVVVQASDPDGRVVTVDYYLDGTNKIDTVDAAPFGTTWHSLPAGVHTLTAVATDNQQATTISAPVTITVLPVNDFFTNRTVIPGLPAVIQEANTLATAEPGEPDNNGNPPENSIWWTWKAPESMTLAITISSNSMPLNLSVFTGTNLNNLSLVAGNSSLLSPTSPLLIPVTAGTSYQIVADGQNGNVGTAMFSLAAAPVPSNDNFAQRTRLQGTNITIRANDLYASEEPGEPSHGDYPGTASLWWSWTAPVTGEAAITGAYDSSNQLDVAVYTGNVLTNLADVDSGSFNAFGTELYFPVTAGVTYQIAFDNTVGYYYPGYGPSLPGPFTWALNCYAPASNNTITNAMPVFGSWLSLTNANAPEALVPAQLWPIQSGDSSLWWSWTAPASGLLTLSCATGQYLDVYSGSALGWNGTNPDGTYSVQAGTTYYIAASGQLGPVQLDLALSTVKLTSPVPGATYTFGQTIPISVSTTKNDGAIAQVEYYTNGVLAGVSQRAPFNFAWQPPGAGLNQVSAVAIDTLGHGRTSPAVTVSVVYPPPINDDFAGRARLQGTWLLVTNSDLGATAQPGEPNIANGGLTDSIWWRWTAPVSGWVTLSSPLSQAVYSPAFYYTSYNPVGVYTGILVSNLVLITQGAGILNFSATAGTTYDIGVDGLETNVVLKLSLSNLQITRPANNSTFTNGAPICLQAQPGSTDGDVQQIEFFANGGSLGVVTNSPWMLMWTNAPVQSNSIMVVATDSLGRDHVSPPVAVTVCLADDSFTNAFALDGESVAVTNFINFADTPPGVGLTAWWKWTAPATGAAAVSVQNGSLFIGVYEPGSGTNLVPVAGDNLNELYPELSSVDFDTVAGRTYYIAVSTWYDSPDAIDLLLTLSSLAITSPAPGSDLSGATNVVISAFDSNPAEQISQIEFFANSNLLGVVTQPPYNLVWTNPPAGDFELSATETDVQGNLHLSAPVAISVAPANDAFANRVIVSGLPATFSGNARNATVEPGEPEFNDPFYGHTVWYSWNSPITGEIQMTPATIRNTYLFGMGVYTGNILTNLQQVNAGTGPVDFSAVAGVTYQFVVGGVYGQTPTADYTFRYDITAHPTNDAFAAAIPLPGTNFTIVGDNSWATEEPGEPLPSPSSAGNSVWYSWTATESGVVTLTVLANLAPSLTVCTGTVVSNLTVLTNGPAPGVVQSNSISFNSVAGTTYWIAVDDGSGEFSLSLNFTSRPGNDNFANRTVLGGVQFSVSGSTLAATAEPGEPEGNVQSVWYSWTAPASGYVRVQCPQLPAVIFTGENLTNLVQVAAPEYWLNDIEFDAIAGQTYPICVYSQPGGGSDDFTLSLQMAKVAVTNIVDGELFTDGTNVTLQAGTIDLGGEVTNVGFYLSPQLYSSPSYSATVSSPPFITTFTNVPLGIYTVYATGMDQSGIITTSKDLTIEVTPRNDDFDNRIELTGDTGTLLSTNTTATLESGEYLPPLATGHTTWWTWTAPACGVITFTCNAQLDTYAPSAPSTPPLVGPPYFYGDGGFVTLSPDYDPLISIYEGSSVTNLAFCANNGVYAQLVGWVTLTQFEFPVTAGQTYQISLDGMQGLTGAESVSYSFTAQSAPPNDNFASRAVLSGGSVSTNGTTIGATLELCDPDLGGGLDGRTVWYSWTAPANGDVTVAVVAGAPGYFDANVGVFAGSRPGSLTTIATSAGNPNGPYFTTYNYASFYAHAGTTYQIEVEAGLFVESDFELYINGPTPAALAPGGPERLPNGGYVIQVTGSTGESFVIQSSTDQQHWTTVDTDTLLSGSLSYTNVVAANAPPQYYRVLPLDTLLNNQPFQMFGPGWQPGNGFYLNLSGNSGQPFLIQTSTNLVDWYNLTSGILTNNSYNFIDYDAPNYPRRFYRAAAQ